MLAMQFPWRVLCCHAAVEVLTEAARLVEESRLASFAADSERLAVHLEWSRLAASARQIVFVASVGNRWWSWGGGLVPAGAISPSFKVAAA